MNEQRFQQQFSSLLDRISDLPQRERSMLMGLAEETHQQETEMGRHLEALSQSIDSMRLCVKYLVFDLEATRRENTSLRRMLADAQQRQSRREESEDDRESFWEDSSE